MKCPVSGKICKPQEIYQINVVMADHRGKIAEGLLTSGPTKAPQVLCGKCKDLCTFDKVIDDLSFLKIQHEYRQMGQSIPTIQHSHIEFKKVGDLQ